MITALLTIAAREGLAAINMRRVANDLGVSPRLIYHHVRDKEMMLAILFDEMLARAMPDFRGLDWEGVLRETIATARRAYAPYPGVAAAILARSANAAVQPNAARVRSAILAALAEAGLDREQVESTYVQFSVMTLGSLVLLQTLDPADDKLAIARSRIEKSVEMGLEQLLAGVRRLAAGE